MVLHRPLCNPVLKVDLVNIKTLHPTGLNVTGKWRYIGSCLALIVLKLELVKTKTLHPTRKNMMWRYIGPCTTLFYTWTFKPHDATCNLKILNMRYIGPCANFFKNLMTLYVTSRCATYDLKNSIWTFWKHFFQQLLRATDRAGPPFGGPALRARFT